MKELVEKIKSDLIKANIIRFQIDANNASTVIEQSISEYFTPDEELVEL